MSIEDWRVGDTYLEVLANRRPEYRPLVELAMNGDTDARRACLPLVDADMKRWQAELWERELQRVTPLLEALQRHLYDVPGLRYTVEQTGGNCHNPAIYFEDSHYIYFSCEGVGDCFSYYHPVEDSWVSYLGDDWELDHEKVEDCEEIARRAAPIIRELAAGRIPPGGQVER